MFSVNPKVNLGRIIFTVLIQKSESQTGVKKKAVSKNSPHTWDSVICVGGCKRADSPCTIPSATNHKQDVYWAFYKF